MDHRRGREIGTFGSSKSRTTNLRAYSDHFLIIRSTAVAGAVGVYLRYTNEAPGAKYARTR